MTQWHNSTSPRNTTLTASGKLPSYHLCTIPTIHTPSKNHPIQARRWCWWWWWWLDKYETRSRRAGEESNRRWKTSSDGSNWIWLAVIVESFFLPSEWPLPLHRFRLAAREAVHPKYQKLPPRGDAIFQSKLRLRVCWSRQCLKAPFSQLMHRISNFLEEHINDWVARNCKHCKAVILIITDGSASWTMDRLLETTMCRSDVKGWLVERQSAPSHQENRTYPEVLHQNVDLPLL